MSGCTVYVADPAVYGVLEAAPHEVVSSIMLDPLTDSPDVRAALVHRDKDKTTNLTISLVVRSRLV